tara:strand:- start:757 stop:1197 length:441 start_codon:yes stop_codon:yes gene_type:complete
MDVVKLIGKSYKTISMVIKEKDVVFFSEATKQEDEIFFNKIVAQNEGFPNIVCPPTYLISVGMKKNILNKCLEDLGIGLEKILHVGQEFNYLDLVFVEDKIYMKTIFKNAYEKNEGKLMFFVYESKFYNQNEVEVCVMKNTLLVRS